MKGFVSMLVMAGLVLLAAPGAQAQVDNIKEKAKKADGDKDRDLKDGDKDRDLRDKDDDDSHLGAIVGGVAAAAVVGALVLGGDDDKDKDKGKGSEALRPAAIDTNKDGAFAKAEFSSKMTASFKTGDKDGDGKVTREEAVAAYGTRGGKYFDALDAKKTGSVSLDTLQNDADQAFQWADANGDGTVTAEERTKAAAQGAEAEKEAKKNPSKTARLLKAVK